MWVIVRSLVDQSTYGSDSQRTTACQQNHYYTLIVDVVTHFWNNQKVLIRKSEFTKSFFVGVYDTTFLHYNRTAKYTRTNERIRRKDSK